MIKFKFSRHANRRLRLYKIDKKAVISSLKKEISKFKFNQKTEIIVNSSFIKKYKYPLKIVFDFKNSEIFIITAYPLKKGR